MIEEKGIYYIGDISKNDAIVLKEMAETHESILEFGCGASTQVLVHYCKEGGYVESIDTSEEWIRKTIDNITLLDLGDRTAFLMGPYDQFIELVGASPHITYDFIFDDGVDHLRREFAIKIWPYLKVGGILAFHDTRRGADFRNVLEVLAHFQDEIGKVEFNYKSSNITLVHKKKAEPYSNWQIDEGKNLPETQWMLGYGDPPQEFIDKMKNL